MIFCLEKIVTLIWICFDIFRRDERLNPPRGNQLSNSKASFGPENKNPIKKLLVQGADPFFL